MKQIDLALEDFEIVRQILSEYVPRYEVRAFGSRVTGKARKYSDLDIVIMTSDPLEFDHYAAIKEAFSESNLPFKVDVIDWAATSENFKKLIEQNYVILQEKP